MRCFYFRADESRDVADWIDYVEYTQNIDELDGWIKRLRTILKHASSVNQNIKLKYPDVKYLYDWMTYRCISTDDCPAIILMPEIPLDYAVITLRHKMYSYLLTAQKWLIDTLTEPQDVQREIIRSGAEAIADILII